MGTFGSRLLAAADDHGRLCVGIDPHAELLRQWGLSDDIEGLRTFTSVCVEAFAGHVALIKPQVAFFERFGSAGFRVLEQALAAIRSTDSLSVADAKRGDIGSTMAGYADAWLGQDSPLRADAVTVSPYLGVGSLQPVFDRAEATGSGVFVLAATSNPEAAALQNTVTADGATVAQTVVDLCARRNAGNAPGSTGVVVGATVAQPPELGQLNGPVLMPGIGAQGGGVRDVERIGPGMRQWLFPNVSRAVLGSGPDPRELRKQAKKWASDFPPGPGSRQEAMTW